MTCRNISIRLAFLYTQGSSRSTYQTLHAQPQYKPPWALPLRHKENILQGVIEELVKLGDLGGDAEVDGSVANLHDESSNDFRVHLSQSG